MAENFNKGGRPPVANKCIHCVKVRFDDLEWDSFIGMMEKANQDVKATFIKQLVFSRPFRVLKTDPHLQYSVPNSRNFSPSSALSGSIMTLL